MKGSSQAQYRTFKTVKRKGSIYCRTDLIHYALIFLSCVLWTSLYGLRSAARCDSVLLQAHHSAHKCLVLLCILFLCNERFLIAFLVRLICYMLLPHYCAVCLKEMYFHFYIYLYINILLVFHECILQQYKEQYTFLPDLVLHLFTFLCSPIKKNPLILDFIKLLCIFLE